MEKYPANYPQEENFSFRKLILERKQDLLYVWSHRMKITMIGLSGGVLGFALSFLWPVSYTARLSFVVEDVKPGGGSIVSALAGQFGFDMSALGNTSGVMAGENVLELLKSNTILKNALLTPYDAQARMSLADAYALQYKLKDRWESKYLDGGKLSFPADRSQYSRLQDSLLQDIAERIVKKELSVFKPDKKLGFFELSTTMKDEKLASLLCSRILEEGANFYIQTKTKRLKVNVDRLQARADSLSALLNRKTYSASSSTAQLVDVNPAYVTAKVGSEVKERDKMVLSTIYAEVVKNLEASKTILAQETPTVQIVDQPDLPLKKNRLKWYEGIAYGGFFAGMFYTLFLLFVKPAKRNN
ncbi:MAG: hypothetical protein RI924_1282 [Bacteroidota bacterium]|jgi:hypothetical protein